MDKANSITLFSLQMWHACQLFPQAFLESNYSMYDLYTTNISDYIEASQTIKYITKDNHYDNNIKCLSYAPDINNHTKCIRYVLKKSPRGSFLIMKDVGSENPNTSTSICN